MVRSWEAPCRPGAEGWRRGDVRSLPVTTSHQWGDVVLSRRAVCPPRPTRRSECVRAGLAAATSADAWRVHLRGETRAPSPPHPPHVGGDGGGRGPILGKHRAGPALMGGGDGLGPVLSLSRTRSRCGTPIPIVIAPDGSNRCRRIKSLRRPTVPTLSLATVVAPTALSLIGCTILRAVSGILRTQCGRRGSGTRETTFNAPLAPVAQLSAPRINSLTSGRRRRSATSHGPWAVCQVPSLPRQIKPGPSVAAVAIGV